MGFCMHIDGVKCANCEYPKPDQVGVFRYIDNNAEEVVRLRAENTALRAEVERAWLSSAMFADKLVAANAELEAVKKPLPCGHPQECYYDGCQVCLTVEENTTLRARLKAMEGVVRRFLGWLNPPTMETGHSAWPLVFEAEAALADLASLPAPKEPEANKHECVHHPEHRNCGKKNCAGFNPEAKDDGVVRFTVERPQGEKGIWDADGDWHPAEAKVGGKP